MLSALVISLRRLFGALEVRDLVHLVDEFCDLFLRSPEELGRRVKNDVRLSIVGVINGRKFNDKVLGNGNLVNLELPGLVIVLP